MSNKPKRKQNKQRKRNDNSMKGFTSVVPYSMGPLNRRQQQTLRYYAVLNLSAATVAVATNIYRMNSYNDPDSTAAGHQPLGYDTLTEFYTKYRVYVCHYIIRFPTAAGTYHATVQPLNDTTTINTLATFQTACEQPRAKNVTVSSTGPTIEVIDTIVLHKFNGVDRATYEADDRFGATFNNNPAEVMNFIVAIYNPTAATVAPFASVEIYMTGELYDPLAPVSSFKATLEEKELIMRRREKISSL